MIALGMTGTGQKTHNRIGDKNVIESVHLFENMVVSSLPGYHDGYPPESNRVLIMPIQGKK